VQNGLSVQSRSPAHRLSGDDSVTVVLTWNGSALRNEEGHSIGAAFFVQRGQSMERLYFTSNEPTRAAVPQWILIPAFPLLSARVMVNSSAESPTFSVFKGSSAM
jgi:hypothetical protein